MRCGISTKYTLLEYIESTGTQYIDTGFKPNNNTRVVIDCILNTGNTYPTIFGTQDSTGSAKYTLLSLTASTIRHYYGNKETDYSYSLLNKRMLVDMNKETLTIDGTKVLTGVSSTFSSVQNMFLLSYDGGTIFTSYGKIYSCQIYDNGTLVRDYIPALRSDGIAGLYDAVNDTFYASSGSENFVAATNAKEIIATQTSVTGTYKIPYGTAYTIEASNVNSYTTPALYGKTANIPQNVVVMQYVYFTHAGTLKPSNGIYIQDTDGYFHTESAWDGTYTSNGVAVITSECWFLIALEDSYSSNCTWGGYGTEVDMITTDPSTDIWSDLDGDAQTTTILEVLGNSSANAPASYYSRAYTFPNGSIGYLGAVGEWSAVLSNITAIGSALIKCGATGFSNVYWTSSQYNENNAWVIGMTSVSLFYSMKNAANATVRSFAPIDIGRLPYITINGSQYQFEEGMTFADWVNSDYNTTGAYIEANNYIYVGQYYSIRDYADSNNAAVTKTTKLVRFRDYYTSNEPW